MYVCRLKLENIKLNIEALIFASEQSVSIAEIRQVLQAALETEISENDLTAYLTEIKKKYDNESYPIALVELNGGFQFLTKQEYYGVIHYLQVQRSKKKLSQAALETLAIIAYRQPVTKLEIEQIRGVNCDYSIQKLLEKELINITGKAETVGKPLLYGTSSLFMDYFGINNSSELPQLKDINTEVNEIGEKAE